MATVRKRGSRFEYVVKRRGLLPKPIYLSFDLHKRTIFLDKTKDGDRRQVPLSSVATLVLKRYRKQAPRGEGSASDRLFPFWEGATSPRALAATTSKLSRRWKRVFELP